MTSGALDHPIPLDDLLADAATELRDDGMTALAAAVEIGRKRIRKLVRGLNAVLETSSGAHAHLTAEAFARAMLNELQSETVPRELRE